jgi:hypothetical protein
VGRYTSQSVLHLSCVARVWVCGPPQSFRLEADTHLADLPRRRAAAYNALMPRPAGLRVRPRQPSGFTIVGTVAGQRIRRRAQSAVAKLAREEAATLEAEILRTAWHGQRRDVHAFDAAAQSYLEASPRSPKEQQRITRLLQALGDVSLAAINQQSAVDLKRQLLRPDAVAGTYVREIIGPLRAILRHAQRLGWCDVPHFEVPRVAAGRTLYLFPGEVERLIAAAAAHLRPAARVSGWDRRSDVGSARTRMARC